MLFSQFFRFKICLEIQIFRGLCSVISCYDGFDLFCVILSSFENIVEKNLKRSDVLIDKAYFTTYFQTL